MVNSKVTAAADRAVRALEAVVTDPGTENTIRAAEAIVSLRRQFKHEGLPDWSGRSPGYRDLIARLYQEAGVPSDSEGNVQANIRYHIGNVLRRVAEPEDLEAAGLAVTSPLDRIKEARVTDRQVRRSRKAVSSAGDPTAMARLALDAVRALRTMGEPGAQARRHLAALADEVAEILEP